MIDVRVGRDKEGGKWAFEVGRRREVGRPQPGLLIPFCDILDDANEELAASLAPPTTNGMQYLH